MIDKSIKGINYRLDEETLTAEVIKQENGYEGDIIIPETVVFQEVAYRVTSIGERAFSGCKSLTSIVIPESVTSIGEEAFDGCDSLKQKPTQEIKLKNIVYRLFMHNHLAMVSGFSGRSRKINILSEINHEGVIYRVTSIEKEAFDYCSSLTSIVIPDSVTSIGRSAFCQCDSLTSIVIPDGVTSIGKRAFDGTSLTSIVIPDSVTSIGEGAFWYCKSLTSITFNGTQAQWNSIEIEDNWKWRIAAQRVRCTDGEVEI